MPGQCDFCHLENYTDDDPYVEVRIPRPSDPHDLCCILGGHLGCASSIPPHTGAHGGVATPKQWLAFIESAEALNAGILWLS